MEDCIFCKIVKKEVPAQIVKETKDFLVFADLHPLATTHLLIIPKEHFTDITNTTTEVWEGIRYIALDLQKQFGLAGFRLENNAGTLAEVKHMHVHFKSGIK